MSRAPTAMAIALALTACARDRAEPARPSLVHEAATPVPSIVMEERFGRRLLAGPAPALEPGTDVIPPRDFLLEEHGQRRAPAVPVTTGWLTAAGAVWATLDETLVDTDGTVLAEWVSPDVAVSPEGDRIAFPIHHDGSLTRVHVLEVGVGAAPVPVTSMLDDALMPFFLESGDMLVSGAQHGEILGVFYVDLSAGTARRLTNEGLRIGEGLGSRFVPVPLGARFMRELDGERVAYFDGDAEQVISFAANERVP